MPARAIMIRIHLDIKKPPKINSSINFNFNFNSKKGINPREELFKTEIKNKILNKPYYPYNLNETKKSDFSTNNTSINKNKKQEKAIQIAF